MTPVEEIIQKLESLGAHEITEEDKNQPWYKEHLKQLERWRNEEVGKPFTVKEKNALYGRRRKIKSSSRT